MTWVTQCPRCKRQRAFNHAAGVCFECAPTSRAAEVEAAYDAATGCTQCGNPDMVRLARTLGAEVDTLRDENIRLERKRLDNVTAARRFLKQLVAERVTLDSLRAKVPSDSWIDTSNNNGKWMVEVCRILYPETWGKAHPLYPPETPKS